MFHEHHMGYKLLIVNIVVPRVILVFINRNTNGRNRNHKKSTHYFCIIVNDSKQTENCNNNSFARFFKQISGCFKMVNGPCV